jgi:hypothetical protein
VRAELPVTSMSIPTRLIVLTAALLLSLLRSVIVVVTNMSSARASIEAVFFIIRSIL